MGLSLKDIFKKDEETLLVDRRKQAIQGLIIFSAVIILLLVILVVVKNIGDADEERRIAITKDIQNIQTYVKNIASEARLDPDYIYPGTSLEQDAITKNINGIEEEYRYGYYLLSPEDYTNKAAALNIPGEYYIVNYDTYDVINYSGIKYNKSVYYSVDDLVAIDTNQPIPSKNTIIIKVASDMKKIYNNPNANFKLAGNIDMSEYAAGEGWNPVERFSGKLDGRGYTISNLTINRPTQSYVGLFGSVSDSAKIMNVTFTDVNITGETYTGVLAGTMNGDIQNVIIASGSVTGGNRTGGLVGSHQLGTINKCKIALDILAGQDEVGGVVGIFNSGTIAEVMVNCQSIRALSSVGGFAGSVSATSGTILRECTATSSISARESIGGMIGKVEMLSNHALDILNCYSKGTIQDGEQNMGGLIGYIRTTAGTSLKIEDGYTSVSMLKKIETTGACIGYSSISNVGGLNIADVFWERNLAVGEILNSVGTVAPGTTPLNFTDKSSAEMKYRSTFANWNFDIWGINERVDTPYLKFENTMKQYIDQVEER